jgi:hypothetical protein
MSNIQYRRIEYTQKKVDAKGYHRRSLTFRVDVDGDGNTPVFVLTPGGKWVMCGVTLGDANLSSEMDGNVALSSIDALVAHRVERRRLQASYKAASKPWPIYEPDGVIVLSVKSTRDMTPYLAAKYAEKFELVS